MCTWLWIALLSGLLLPVVLAVAGWLFDNKAVKYTAEMEALEQEVAEWKRKYEAASLACEHLQNVLTSIRNTIPSDH